VDELYEAVLLKPFYAISRFSAGSSVRHRRSGQRDGIVADITGQILKLFQTGYVNYALVFLMGVVAMLVYLATV
jgi:hypothetical protein